MLTKIRRWGNSRRLRFTKVVREGRIIVEPVATVRGRHDLKTLVSTIPEGYRAEEVDWGPPAGKETW